MFDILPSSLYIAYDFLVMPYKQCNCTQDKKGLHFGEFIGLVYYYYVFYLCEIVLYDYSSVVSCACIENVKDRLIATYLLSCKQKI